MGGTLIELIVSEHARVTSQFLLKTLAEAHLYFSITHIANHAEQILVMNYFERKRAANRARSVFEQHQYVQSFGYNDM